MKPLFSPTPGQLNGLIILAFSTVGYALYLRYLAIEPSAVGLACEGGLRTWLCSTRSVFIALFSASIFGWLALGSAVLNLLRPSMLLLSIALAAAGFGIVLYNVGLSSVAVALLVFSLARPASAAGAP